MEAERGMVIAMGYRGKGRDGELLLNTCKVSVTQD